MRRLLFFSIILLSSVRITTAQTTLERANDYFEKAYYTDAIPLYEVLIPKDRSYVVINNLADSYYHTFNMKAAARWYAYLISNHSEKVSGAHYFKWSQALKASGDFGKAYEVLHGFYEKNKDSLTLKKLDAEQQYLDNVKAIGNRYHIENLPLNTETSEFGAMVKDSLLVYTAARKKTQAINKVFRWNNQNYLDLYVHKLTELQYADSLSTSFSKNINTNMHEGTFAFSKDGQTLYFTRNNTTNGKRRANKDKISNLKIYKATLKNGEWENIIALPFNNDDYSCEHPALNRDGTKLYFASDMPGGHGSFDLYSVIIHKDGSFGNPINLGGTINTDKKEQFPFLNSSNNLYFASNGHPGFGSLDIFIARYQNGKFNTPDNLGLPLNSGYDDFSYFMNKNGSTGYFTSNRPTGQGSDDIYSFEETKPLVIENCKQYIKGIVRDITTQKPIPNVRVELFNAANKLVKNSITEKDGSYTFTVECETLYKVLGTKTGYENGSKSIRTDRERAAIKNGDLSLLSIKEKERQQQLQLEKQKEEEIARFKRENEKKLRLEKEAIEKAKLQKRLEEEQKKKLIAKQKEERAKKIEDAIQTEDAIVKDKDVTYIKTKEIHFDYSLWYLRRETRERLKVVVATMDKYPKMVVEIGSHTDIRGNSKYNKDLSQKRADAVKDFLVGNGIAEQRIIAKGYGESQPIVKCGSEETCTEEDHEWNRRCEFTIIRWE